MKRRSVDKRIALALLAVDTALSLTACDSSAASSRGNYEEKEDEEDKEKEEPTPEVTIPDEPGKDIDVTPTPEPTPAPDYEAMYKEVLAENLEIILNGYDYEKEYRNTSNGIIERVMYRSSDELLKSIGYVLQDINGDAVPELMIGENPDYDPAEGSDIFALYTLSGDKAMFVFEGWSRSSYHWMGDGKFYYFGSGGAFNSSVGQCHLDQNAALVWDDYYFTEEKNGEAAYYHNTSGSTDPSVSDELNIDAASFFMMMDGYKQQRFSFTPIDAFEGADQIKAKSASPSGAESIVGQWGLRSYVNMKVKDYEIFADGTWLAVEAMPELAMTGSPAKGDYLAGAWAKDSSSSDTDAYSLYDLSGGLYMNVHVYEDADGYTVMETDDGMSYYYSDIYVPEYIAGSWLFPNGAAVSFDEAGGWNYYDDNGGWVLGGHYVYDVGPGFEYLRLHTPAGDTGNVVFGEGLYRTDAMGDTVIDMEFTPMFRGIAGSAAALYKSL